MKIEVRELMDDNEMLSHIFLGCMSHNELKKIRDKHIGDADWEKESVKIPVEMKIGGVSVNPKSFFDEWKRQMQSIVHEQATKLLSEKIGSGKLQDLIGQIHNLSQVFEHFESEITWDSVNPFNITQP